MLFRPSRPPQLIVEVPPSTSPPRAVVILLGWWGAQLRHVRKYTALYDNCATITTVLDPRALLWADEVKTDELVALLVTQAAKLLRYHHDDSESKIPLIFHVFSNGGAIPLFRLETLLSQHLAANTKVGGVRPQTNQAEDNEHSPSENDWKLFHQSLAIGAEIFDSAPAFPDLETFQAALRAGLGGSSSLVAVLATHLLVLFAVAYYHSLMWLSHLGGRKRLWVEEYWAHWLNAPHVAAVQAYIYSESDTITKSEKLDALVHERQRKCYTSNQQRQGLPPTQVLVQRFEDSAHVQQYRQHPVAYRALLDQVMKQVDVNGGINGDK